MPSRELMEIWSQVYSVSPELQSNLARDPVLDQLLDELRLDVAQKVDAMYTELATKLAGERVHEIPLIAFWLRGWLRPDFDAKDESGKMVIKLAKFRDPEYAWVVAPDD